MRLLACGCLSVACSPACCASSRLVPDAGKALAQARSPFPPHLARPCCGCCGCREYIRGGRCRGPGHGHELQRGDDRCSQAAALHRSDANDGDNGGDATGSQRGSPARPLGREWRAPFGKTGIATGNGNGTRAPHGDGRSGVWRWGNGGVAGRVRGGGRDDEPKSASVDISVARAVRW